MYLTSCFYFEHTDENDSALGEKEASDEENNSQGSDEDDDKEMITEIRFVPSDKAACE